MVKGVSNDKALSNSGRSGFAACNQEYLGTYILISRYLLIKYIIIGTAVGTEVSVFTF